MPDKEKKVFVKPELIKFDKPLNEVTMTNSGTNHVGNGCPPVCISRASYKQNIHYLDPNERAAYAKEVLNFKLATYRYKTDGDRGRMNLGFIIDDVEPSVSVYAEHDRVDLFGFTSMAVAALQEQTETIDGLQRELETLKDALKAMTREKK